MLWCKFGFSITAGEGKGKGWGRGGGAFPATVPFPRLRPGLSLDLTFSTPRLSESRAWFRNQQTSANLNGEGRRVRFFVRRTTHLKKVSQRFFEMRKYGVKPFPPPPLCHPRLPSPSVCDFAFCFPATLLVKIRSQPATHRTIQNTPHPLS